MNIVFGWLIISIVILFIGILIWKVRFLLQGAPYVPSDEQTIADMISLAKKYHASIILDLGSGDGRLVLALAQAGFAVDGVEIDRGLVKESQKLLAAAKVKNATIIKGNFWEFDTSHYDLIVIYAVKLVMPRLQKKLQKELRPKSYVFSNYAPFPDMVPIEKKNLVLAYRI